MLGPNKWRLLTIVAGILLAHAIDSPNRSAPRLNQPSHTSSSYVTLSSLSAPISPTSTHLGLTIEKFSPGWNSYRNSNSERRLARNLYTPFKRFSNIDDVRYVERRQTTGYRNNVLDLRTTFGAFRYDTNGMNTARRRSDVDDATPIFEYSNSTLSNPLSDESAVTTLKPTTLQVIKRHKYSYIPLGGTPTNNKNGEIENNVEFFERTTLPDFEIRSRTDLNVYQTGDGDDTSDMDDVDDEQSTHNSNRQKAPEQLAESSESLPQALALRAPSGSFQSNKVSFVKQSNAAYSLASPTNTAPTDDDIRGRRSGMTFTQQTPKFDPPFIPKSYQEDDPNHPNFQIPYSEELSPSEPAEIRTARGAHYEQLNNNNYRSSTVQFPGPSTNKNGKPFRDDVTKFGDVNGPITSLQQRQFSDFYESQGGIRTYENIYYSDDFRRPRQQQQQQPQSYYQSAPKSPYYDYEYNNQPLRSRLIVPYKSSRTPRVIFPSNDNLPNGIYTGENYSNNDNIVFR